MNEIVKARSGPYFNQQGRVVGLEGTGESGKYVVEWSDGVKKSYERRYLAVGDELNWMNVSNKPGKRKVVTSESPHDILTQSVPIIAQSTSVVEVEPFK